MTKITIGTKQIEVVKGDFILQTDNSYLFVAGDKRTLNRIAYLNYHSLEMNKKDLAQFDLDSLNSEDCISVSEDGKESVVSVKYYL